MTIPSATNDLTMTGSRKFPEHWGQVCGSCIHFTAQPFGATCMKFGGGGAFTSDSATCCPGFKRRKDR